MAGSDGAGRSADEWSQRLRQKAARLEAQADRIDQGARGERRTGEVLNPRSGDGWYVLHDLAVPNSRANIDHVVVTSAGVFVVDSKDWSGRISAGKDTIWVYRYPKTRELETLLWETSVVATTLRAALPSHTIPVRGVISLTNATPTRPVLAARGITAVAVGDLIQHLAAAPTILDSARVEYVAGALNRGLRSKSGAASSIVRPDPLPSTLTAPPPATERNLPRRAAIPPPPMAPWRPTPDRRSGRPVGYTPRWSAPPRPRRPTPGSAALRKAATVTGIAFAGLVALGMVGNALKRPIPTTPSAASEAPATATTNTAPATPATSPTTAAPAGARATWTCPALGRGWTATLAWPAGESPHSFTVAQIAPSASGPWTLATSSRGPTPIQVTGIAGGTTEWVRAGDLTTIQLSGKSVMEGPITAPNGC